MQRWFTKTTIPIWWGVLLTTLVGWVLVDLKLSAPVRYSSYDWLQVLRGTRQVDEAVIVYLDEQSHFELKQPLNAAWDRTLHARLVQRLTKAGAKAVVFDIVFAETGRTNAADLEFAQALGDNRRVILGANARYENSSAREPSLDLPYETARHAIEDRWGHVLLPPVYDQVVREHPPFYPPFKPSLSWAAAGFLNVPIAIESDEKKLEASANVTRWLNYYGPAYHIPYVNYATALDPTRVEDAFFRDKIVLVGASTLTKYSGERKDSYMSPFSMWERNEQRLFIAGVEIQATAILNLVRGDWLFRPAHRWEQLMVLLIGPLAGWFWMRLRPIRATAAMIIAVLATAALAYFLFVTELVWFPWLVLALQFIIAWAYSIAANSVRLFVQNRLLEQTLSLYVTPKLARKLAREGGGKLLKPGAEKQELTIFFSDIEGFTSITERIDSNELAPLMNQYFETAVGQCIHPADGTVVKYIGDAIFAFWNAPEEQHDHAVRACEAAMLFRDQKHQEINGHRLVTRIGLHTGVANVGNFGSSSRVDYSAFGSSINLASRMEGLNKYLGTKTLLTGATQSAIGDRFHTRYLGLFKLKGFEAAVDVHELVGRYDSAHQIPEWYDEFAAGVRAFQAGEFQVAQDWFQQAADQEVQDGPTQYYLAELERCLGKVRPELWKGEIELTEK